MTEKQTNGVALEPSPVSAEQVARMLAATPGMLRAQLAAVDDALLRWRPAPGEWCIKEVIGHLIETDRVAFMGRIRLMLAEERPTLGGMDVNGVAAARRDDAKPLADLLAELEETRRDVVSFVAGLTPEQMTRPGFYPRLEGDLTVADFVYEWPFHDAGHMSQIQDNLRAYLLPNMGDRMRRAVGG